MAVISQIIIDPFGTQPDHSTSTSKSIFKEQNLRSGTFNSNNLSLLTSVVDNNAIIDGLNFSRMYFSNSNHTIHFEFNPGRLIQDFILFDVLETVNVSIDVFSEYDINAVSITENYFRISGDHTINFPPNKTFGVFNSSTSGYNHTNWSVVSTTYTGGYTYIYTSQSLTVNDHTGLIVNDNFPNTDASTQGLVIITSQFKYMDTVEDNEIKFIPVYINSTYEYTPTFSVNLNKIIYSVFSITKDMANFIILPTVYGINDDIGDLSIHGTNYRIHNTTDLIETDTDINVDGGELIDYDTDEIDDEEVVEEEEVITDGELIGYEGENLIVIDGGDLLIYDDGEVIVIDCGDLMI